MKMFEVKRRLIVNDVGMKLTVSLGGGGKRPKTLAKRGAVTGSSVASRRRLRAYLLENEVCGLDCWAVTLTVKFNVVDPVKWRAVCKSLNTWCLVNNYAGVWRVELQRRGVPHLHVVFWGDPNSLRDYWLVLWGLQNDVSSLEYAVDVRSCGSGWYGYIAMHSAKNGVQACSWSGRTWGVWNRKLFSERGGYSWDLSEGEYLRVWKILDFVVRRRYGRRNGLNYFVGCDHIGLDSFSVCAIVDHVRKSNSKKVGKK